MKIRKINKMLKTIKKTKRKVRDLKKLLKVKRQLLEDMQLKLHDALRKRMRRKENDQPLDATEVYRERKLEEVNARIAAAEKSGHAYYLSLEEWELLKEAENLKPGYFVESPEEVS